MGWLGLGQALGESLVTISAMWTARRRRHSTSGKCPRLPITALVATIVATAGVGSALSGTPDELTTAPETLHLELTPNGTNAQG